MWSTRIRIAVASSPYPMSHCNMFSTISRFARAVIRRSRRPMKVAQRTYERTAEPETPRKASCVLPSPPTSPYFFRPSQPDMSLLSVLPTELIMKALHLLDWRSLIACSQVCVAFHEAISTSVECQYVIELAVAGMEDGPHSTLLLSERRQRLQEHQAAWQSLRWRSEKPLGMLDGGVWELYGGVLARARGTDTLVFNRLPSEIKGIEEREWELTPQGLGGIRDFAIEPACDLLVIIEEISHGTTYRIHLRSMETGKDHEKACRPATLTHSPHGVEFSFAIQTLGEYLGILFISNDERESQLLVWNWQTGVLALALRGHEIGSFCFLTEDRILIGVVNNPEPSLVVVNFKNVSNEVTQITDVDYEFTLQYPGLHVWATALAISIRSDPSPTWQPHPSLQVPFYTAQHERLLAMTLWVAEGANIHTILLFVPFTTILSRARSLSPADHGRRFAWHEWGPTGSRMIKAPPAHSMIWVCYIFGMAFVSPLRSTNGLNPPVAVQIFDFNQLALRKHLADPERHGDDEVTHIVQEPTNLNMEQIFQVSITTHLPYRWKFVKVPVRSDHAFNAVMLSEDSIVTVTSNPNVREYRILSF